MTKESIAKAPSGRPKRKSVGIRNRLEIINKDPDRVYRLIDADPARIYQFDQTGYRVETIKDHLPGAERIDSNLIMDNSIPVGGGKRQVLVSIDKDWYEEDQRAKMAAVDETEEAIKNTPTTTEGFYGKVTIQK